MRHVEAVPGIWDEVVSLAPERIAEKFGRHLTSAEKDLLATITPAETALALQVAAVNATSRPQPHRSDRRHQSRPARGHLPRVGKRTVLADLRRTPYKSRRVRMPAVRPALGRHQD
jgi:hypothetical protein